MHNDMQVLLSFASLLACSLYLTVAAATAGNLWMHWHSDHLSQLTNHCSCTWLFNPPAQCVFAITFTVAACLRHHAGDGYIAIGSEDGCVRMYGLNSLERAITTIKGLGGPITAVDVTYDGKWVLAPPRTISWL